VHWARLSAALGCASLLAAACASGPTASSRSSEAYANFLVGRMADLRDDHRAASDRLYHALRSAPGDATLSEGALTASLAVGDIARARDVARQAAAQDLDVGYAHIVRATDALSAGRWRQARTSLALTNAGSAEELTERLLLTWASVGAGTGERAAEQLDEINAPRPYDALLDYTRALALDASDREVFAQSAYQEAIASGFWLPPAAERYADLLARSGDAVAGVELLRSREGRFGSPAQIAAIARMEAGGQAAPEALNPARGAAISLYGLGLIFLEEGDSTHGLATLTLALMLDPGLDAARLAFADAQLDLGHVAEAEAALDAISPSSSYAGNARLMRALISLREERTDEAVAIARAYADDGGGPRALRALADLYRSMERYGEAEPIYSELIDSSGDDGDWRLYFARATTRERQGRWSEAEADLQRALELAPDQPDVLNYLGYTWVDRGERLQEGLAMIERAVEARPSSGAIIDSLGWAHFRLGDFETALNLLERAVALSPADPVLNDHLGDAYWRVGRRTEARFQWRRALSLDPAEAERTLIEAKLEDGLPAIPETRSATR
jgi:tetratricopeptide (TPR) repeat protein